jgi:hypothetical protein
VTLLVRRQAQRSIDGGRFVLSAREGRQWRRYDNQ